MRYLKSIIFVAALCVAPSLSFAKAAQHDQHVQVAYFCPMHPSYTSDKPGACPICGMDLIKKKEAVPAAQERKVLFYRNPMDPAVTSPVPMKDGMGMDYVPVYEQAAPASSGVVIDQQKQQLIGVRTGSVAVRSLTTEVRVFGRVVVDEELFQAQKAYLNSDLSSTFWNEARQKLLNLGMSEGEIKDLKKRRWVDQGILATAPRTRSNYYRTPYKNSAWVYASVYENEAALLKPQDHVMVSSPAFPGETFHGMVAGVAQVVDPATRTVRVRVRVEDENRRLRPEMSVTAMIAVDLGERLSVPVEAILPTGERMIAHVVVEDAFTPREVKIGVRAGEYYEVLEGLSQGDRVVTSGNFLVDAETRLKGTFDAHQH